MHLDSDDAAWCNWSIAPDLDPYLPVYDASGGDDAWSDSNRGGNLLHGGRAGLNGWSAGTKTGCGEHAQSNGADHGSAGSAGSEARQARRNIGGSWGIP